MTRKFAKSELFSDFLGTLSSDLVTFLGVFKTFWAVSKLSRDHWGVGEEVQEIAEC